MTIKLNKKYVDWFTGEVVTVTDIFKNEWKEKTIVFVRESNKETYNLSETRFLKNFEEDEEEDNGK